jgi:hypothetical protein
MCVCRLLTPSSAVVVPPVELLGQVLGVRLHCCTHGGLYVCSACYALRQRQAAGMAAAASSVASPVLVDTLCPHADVMMFDPFGCKWLQPGDTPQFSGYVKMVHWSALQNTYVSVPCAIACV